MLQGNVASLVIRTSFKTLQQTKKQNAKKLSQFQPFVTLTLSRLVVSSLWPSGPPSALGAGDPGFVCLFVGCVTSQQQTSVSQARICPDHFTCCHTELEIADPTFYLTQSQYTDTGRPVPVLTLYRQAPGRVATGVPIFKALV